MWREKLLNLDPELSLHDPARPEPLAELERALAVPIPRDLAALLRESDGVSDRYGAGLVWPTERIVGDNNLFSVLTRLRKPLDALRCSFFFADAGNGDQFAFPITTAGARNDVFVWDHEDDSRRWHAGSLEQYLVWWLSGKHPV